MFIKNAVPILNFLYKTINHQVSNLVDYSASYIFPDIFYELTDAYLEYPFKSKNILGHTLKNELGLTVTINQNIDDNSRKLFTSAHELGHVVLHKNLMPTFDFTNIENNIDLSYVEQQANWFAANLLLPTQVLYAHIIEYHTIKQIKRFSGISMESAKYRIDAVLTKKYWIQHPTLIDAIIKDYLECDSAQSVKSSMLYTLFLKGNKLPHIEKTNLKHTELLDKKIKINRRIEKNMMYSTNLLKRKNHIVPFL